MSKEVDTKIVVNLLGKSNILPQIKRDANGFPFFFFDIQSTLQAWRRPLSSILLFIKFSAKKCSNFSKSIIQDDFLVILLVIIYHTFPYNKGSFFNDLPNGFDEYI